MPDNHDLLVKLYRWAHHQGENFTTEAFAHLLEHLIDNQPEAALEVLSWLTAGRCALTTADTERLQVQTQFWTKDHGVQDLRLLGSDLDIIVEVKLDEKLTSAQVEAYRAELEREGKARRVLVALTGKPPFERLPDDVVQRLWCDLGEQLEKIVDDQAPITTRVVYQFLALLGDQRLLRAPAVQSPLGEALAVHRERAEQDRDQPSLFNSRVRKLDVLDGWDELAPLRAFLEQLREVLGERDHKLLRLESGVTGRYPWIGYCIDYLRYFVELNLDEPSRLTFVRYHDQVDPAFFDKKLGRIVRSHGKYRWYNELDLVKVGYHGRDARAQTAILREFIDVSMEYAAQLRTLGS
jgi:hypothetical protein